MMIDNNKFEPAAPAAQPDGGDAGQNLGCLGELGFLSAGLGLTAASLGYYRAAARCKTVLAIGPFLLVGLIVTLLITLATSREMYSVVDSIQLAYDRNQIPTITIENGVASVDGPEPVIFSPENADTLLAVDTTGQISEIDTIRYQSGFLITRTELHVHNRGNQYQRMQLSNLNALFSADPLVIDRQSVTTFWAGLSAVLSVLVFIGVLLWVVVFKLAYIALLALPIWGLASLIRQNMSFNTVFITGLLASIPALYLVYLLGLVKINFLFMGTLVELVLWLALLVMVLNQQDRPLPTWQQLKPWRALIALPVLSFFGLNVLFDFQYGAVIGWALAVVTVVAMVVAGVLKGPEMQEGVNIQPM